MVYKNIFNKLISPENLFLAWDQFKSGKRSKNDVMGFEMDLEQNIFSLAKDLKDKTYVHGAYTGFFISDPKLRHIHKATVRDRVLHHAVFNSLNPIFEPTFINDSFSCRVGKGTHKGVSAVANMLRKVSKNNTRNCYALKCDIRKFFDSVDHEILKSILAKRIKDPGITWLVDRLVDSYNSLAEARERERERERALPPRGARQSSQLRGKAFRSEILLPSSLPMFT
jgi:retron-type reverse transcriptase